MTKKTLLLQTTLAAAAGLLVAGAANAQTKEVPVGVTVGGYYTYFYKVQDRDKTAQVDESSQATGNDAEIWFNIRGVLDNGTVVGGRIELEGTTYSDQIDETYLFIEKSDVGRIELGATDRVTGKMLYFAPNALPGHSTTVNSEYSASKTGPLMWFANSGHDNDGINIYSASNRYLGSKVGKGLQVGASYVPNGCQDFSGCGGGFSSTADAGQLSQQYAVAANYLESFGPVDAALYASYNSVHIEGTLSTGVTDPRQAGWQVGAQFAYNIGDGSAIQLGGGYSNEDVGRAATGGSVIKDRSAYSLGLKYLTNGSKPGSVGIGAEYYYRDDKYQTAVATGSKDTLKYYTLGVTYQLATAVQTFAGVGVSDSDLGSTTNDPKQTFGVVGIGLRF